MQIALELEPFPLSLVNNVDTMVRFIDDVDHPAVQANIDISHLLLGESRARGTAPAEGQGDSRPHLRLRRQEARRPAARPRRGADFEPYLREIKDLGIDGAISIELEYSPEPEKIVEWVDEAYRETDKLMQAAGLRGERGA